MLHLSFAISLADDPGQYCCPYCHGRVTRDKSITPEGDPVTSFIHPDPCHEAQLHSSSYDLPPYSLDKAMSNWPASLSHQNQALWAKIQAGNATLAQFRQMQSRLIELEHDRLAQEALDALIVPFPLTKTEQHQHFEKMRSFYQLQLGATLFLTEFKTAKGKAWAGGATYQTAFDIEQRLSETCKTIGPVSLLNYEEVPRAGGVWHYVCHRFQEQKYYWRRFCPGIDGRLMSSDMVETLRTELAEMTAPAWVDSLLAGKHTAVSQTLEDRWTHSRRTRAGMHHTDKTLGRPIESAEQTLAKYPEAVNYLREGLSIRQTAKAVGISVNTVCKVNNLLQERR